MTRPSIQLSEAVLPLAYAGAEEPVKGAPLMPIDGQRSCIPQHYLQYNHTYETVSEIVEDIAFDERYPVFVSVDDGNITIQVGIVGLDNYRPVDDNNKPHIVYGRKWRVEKNLPSTEIIQTVFLALQKAREHEVREVLRLRDIATDKRSTPFSGHHDAPLLARIVDANRLTHALGLNGMLSVAKQLLSLLDFDGLPLILKEFHIIGNRRYLLDIAIDNSQQKTPEQLFFPEFADQTISIIVDQFNENAFIHALMEALLNLSNEHVAENFTYRAFKRFSKFVDIKRVGEVSIAIRDKSLTKDTTFEKTIKSVNQHVDSTRVPVLDAAALKKQDVLCRFENLVGHKPLLSFVRGAED